MKLLLTGGTGFLGKYLIRELAPHFEVIYIISRNLENSLFNKYPNVQLIKGDITQLNIISPEMSDTLCDVDVVIHAAALYDLKASRSDLFLQNVIGTQNVISLLNGFKSLKAFFYVSTIAVADPDLYFIEEDSLPHRSSFKDSYSETKYIAEKLVRDIKNNTYKIRIIRPGIIVGDTLNGHIDRIDGPYYFIDAIRRFHGLLTLLPYLPLSYNPKTKLPIIPVDHCASSIAYLVNNIKSDKNDSQMTTYHVISDEIPSLKEFLDDVNEHYHLKTKYLPMKQSKLTNSVVSYLGIPVASIPFMFSRVTYDKTNTLRDIPMLKNSLYKKYKNIFLE